MWSSRGCGPPPQPSSCGQRDRTSRFPPHSNGEVSASYADGGVMSCSRVAAMTPPSPYDGATSPYEWGGKSREGVAPRLPASAFVDNHLLRTGLSGNGPVGPSYLST